MTSRSSKRPFASRTRSQTVDKSGFSLIEVVIATGLCTYALIVLASLMPLGLGVMQTASQQTIETEIFNEMWSEFNTTPFSDLSPSSSQPTNLFNSTAATPFWFDPSGDQLSTQAGAIYQVRCTLVNSSNYSAAGAVLPAVDGGTPASGTSSAYLNFVKIQIGYHVDPQTASPTDPRVVSRTFLLVKRD
jgi:uncharacterized protein (TIGR02598 family)